VTGNSSMRAALVGHLGPEGSYFAFLVSHRVSGVPGFADMSSRICFPVRGSGWRSMPVRVGGFDSGMADSCLDMAGR